MSWPKLIGKNSSQYKHGQCGTPLYTAWREMRYRCNTPSSLAYVDYGGRGIRVCKRWEKFENFAADMGPHPGKGWSLDRKNNDSGYSKRNCRWATSFQQQRNRRCTKLTLSDIAEIRFLAPFCCGRGDWQGAPRLTQVALGKEFGVHQNTISQIARGMRG